MRLSQLLKNLSCSLAQGSEETEITGIGYISKEIHPGNIFVCLEGEKTDGHKYAGEAAARGASAVVCRRDLSLPEGIAVVRTGNTRKALALISAAFYGYPAREMITVGITGTKGKTTVSYMLKSVLEAAGLKTGLIGTVASCDGTKRISSENTTPESKNIHECLRRMSDNGCKYAILEVSSQALMMDRVFGIMFDYGIFTNIGVDHIGKGEHKSLEDYIFWKSRLFSQCRTGILNGDDPRLKEILRGSICRAETYGFSGACGLRGKNFRPEARGRRLYTSFETEGVYNKKWLIPMPGKFNCYNAMAAIAAAGSLSLNAEDVEEGLGRVRVPGRQEIFPFGKNKTVMVDYAHNGAALEGLLAALRDYGPGKITCVFGCGGERSPSRRGEMGKAASKGADSIIITSDNPRGESPMAIIAGIEKEVKKHGTPYIIIPDRRKAIYHAVCRCKEGGIAVIAGKGHEDWQITGAGKIHFDDREEVLAAIRQAETAHGRHRATAREKVKNERIYDKGDQGRGIGEALGRGREQSDQ